MMCAAVMDSVYMYVLRVRSDPFGSGEIFIPRIDSDTDERFHVQKSPFTSISLLCFIDSARQFVAVRGIGSMNCFRVENVSKIHVCFTGLNCFEFWIVWVDVCVSVAPGGLNSESAGVF